MAEVPMDAALNSAAWEFDRLYDARLGEPMPPILFNNLKPLLKATIEHWLEKKEQEKPHGKS